MHELVEVAAQYFCDAMHCGSSAVVLEVATLVELVGTNLVAERCVTARSVFGVLLSLELGSAPRLQSLHEHAPCFDSVCLLSSVCLTADHDAGRYVAHTHGSVSFVRMLSARSTRQVSRDDDVRVREIDVDCVVFPERECFERDE